MESMYVFYKVAIRYRLYQVTIFSGFSYDIPKNMLKSLMTLKPDGSIKKFLYLFRSFFFRACDLTIYWSSTVKNVEMCWLFMVAVDT